VVGHGRHLGQGSVGFRGSDVGDPRQVPVVLRRHFSGLAVASPRHPPHLIFPTSRCEIQPESLAADLGLAVPEAGFGHCLSRLLERQLEVSAQRVPPLTASGTLRAVALVAFGNPFPSHRVPPLTASYNVAVVALSCVS